MTAGLWIVGGPTSDDREDLRYSLRSVAVNAPEITEAWVVGDPPGWFTGCRIPLPPHPEKFQNQRASLTAFCETPGVPETFHLFNDDMFLIEPVESLPTFRNRGRTFDWNTDHADNNHSPSCWTCACRDTATWAALHGAGDAYLYECHTPLKFDTARLRDLLNAYPARRRLAVGELYPLAGIGGEGTHAGNAKVKAHDSLADKLANPMPYLSSNPDTWPGAVADHIKPLFPNPSPWEA